MRIVLDANVLLSACLFPGGSISDLVNRITSAHNLVLSSTIIDEMKKAVSRKFPDKTGILEEYLSRLTYEYQYLPEAYLSESEIEISDPKDKHVLASALFAGADILITGDKHFFERRYKDIKVLRPSEFLEKY
jgi:putative PIN family toxin of toxin-antitoxin system